MLIYICKWFCTELGLFSSSLFGYDSDVVSGKLLVMLIYYVLIIGNSEN
jgi:hypothetical protein